MRRQGAPQREQEGGEKAEGRHRQGEFMQFLRPS
jgi:hypothetical protein